MSIQDDNRAEWLKTIERLREMPCENANPDDLDAVERAIRRSPHPSISDACLQINGGWISGLRYEVCLAFLLHHGLIEPSGFGVFKIDRSRLPMIEVENPIADGIDIASGKTAPLSPVDLFQGNLF